MKIVGVSVSWKWDRLVTYWLALVVCVSVKIHKSMLLLVNASNIAGWVANSIDPNQTPRSAAFDLDLHCLLRIVFPILVNYGSLIKSKPSNKELWIRRQCNLMSILGRRAECQTDADCGCKHGGGCHDGRCICHPGKIHEHVKFRKRKIIIMIMIMSFWKR